MLSLMFFNKANAQQNVLNTDHKVTFQLKITQIANPDSVAIVWSIQPYVEGKTVQQVSFFPKTLDTNGLYQQTITFPDSVMGKTIDYLQFRVVKILHTTFEACRRAGIVAVSARQLKPIEKLMMKLTTKSQIEFGQARY